MNLEDAAAFVDLGDGQATTCQPDPEVRLEALARSAGPLRRVVAALAGRLVACEGWQRLGYARLGDYARERLGCSARSLQDWARVERALAGLPGLERALVDGALAWSKVRLLARFVVPEDEATWIAWAQMQSVRAVERAARAANRGALEAGAASAGDATKSEGVEEGARAWVRIPASFGVAMKWQRLRKAAPQVAGQRLPAGAVLEMVTAEVLSALPLPPDGSILEGEHIVQAPRRTDPGVEERSDERPRPEPSPEQAPSTSSASGVSPAVPCELPRFLRPLLEGMGTSSADPFELDARLRRAMRLAQRLEADLGPLLRQVSSPEYEWKGAFTSLGTLARERLGMSPRKVRALLQVERAGDLCPALGSAYRDGRLSWFQAQLLVRLLARDAEGAWRERWVAFAQQVSARRLEEAVEAALVCRKTDPEAWMRWQDEPERWAATGVEVAGTDGEGRQVCAPREGTSGAGCPRAWRVAASLSGPVPTSRGCSTPRSRACGSRWSAKRGACRARETHSRQCSTTPRKAGGSTTPGSAAAGPRGCASSSATAGAAPSRGAARGATCTRTTSTFASWDAGRVGSRWRATAPATASCSKIVSSLVEWKTARENLDFCRRLFDVATDVPEDLLARRDLPAGDRRPVGNTRRG